MDGILGQSMGLITSGRLKMREDDLESNWESPCEGRGQWLLFWSPDMGWPIYYYGIANGRFGCIIIDRLCQWGWAWFARVYANGQSPYSNKLEHQQKGQNLARSRQALQAMSASRSLAGKHSELARPCKANLGYPSLARSCQVILELARSCKMILAHAGWSTLAMVYTNT